MESGSRRFEKAVCPIDGGNVRNISFGTKNVDGRPERCVRFWVKRKREPRSKRNRIPETVEVKLWRPEHNRYDQVSLVTDIKAVGKFQPTGEYVAAYDTLACSTGLVLNIRRAVRGAIYDLTGLLTVAHPFRNIPRHRFPVECQSRTINGITGENVNGIMRYRTLFQKFDAAFMQCSEEELAKGYYLVNSGISSSILLEDEIYQLKAASEECQLLAAQVPGIPIPTGRLHSRDDDSPALFWTHAWRIDGRRNHRRFSNVQLGIAVDLCESPGGNPVWPANHGYWRGVWLGASRFRNPERLATAGRHQLPSADVF